MDLRKLSAIEWLKINRYFIFWGMLALAFAAMATAFWGIDSILSEIRSNAAKQSPIPIPEVSVYRIPGIWHNLTFIRRNQAIPATSVNHRHFAEYK